MNMNLFQKCPEYRNGCKRQIVNYYTLSYEHPKYKVKVTVIDQDYGFDIIATAPRYNTKIYEESFEDLSKIEIYLAKAWLNVQNYYKELLLEEIKLVEDIKKDIDQIENNFGKYRSNL